MTHRLHNSPNSEWLTTREWIYVFKPTVAETVGYIQLIVRADCVIISFHEDRDQTDEDND
jgi:hypothetical protein